MDRLPAVKREVSTSNLMLFISMISLGDFGLRPDVAGKRSVPICE